jgi:hypothetical protein
LHRKVFLHYLNLLVIHISPIILLLLYLSSYLSDFAPNQNYLLTIEYPVELPPSNQSSQYIGSIFCLM